MRVSPQHRASTGERLNTAETTGRLQQALGKRRIRLTRQRRVILQVMDDAEQHLDVDQILERAQKIDSGVALVTVYRTIDLLKKHGLIDELDLLTATWFPAASNATRARATVRPRIFCARSTARAA